MRICKTPCKRGSLVHLNNTVYFADKPKAGEESDGASKEEEEENHDDSVAKVEKSGSGILDGELGGEVVAAVNKEITGGAGGAEEGAPPPVVVLRT